MPTKITHNDFSSEFYSSFGNMTVTGISYQYSINAHMDGGETITITGSGFVNGAKVMVNNKTRSTTVLSSTQLTFTSPPNPVGTYLVYIGNPDGTIAVLYPGITYVSSISQVLYDIPGTYTWISPPYVTSICVVAVGGGGGGNHGWGANNNNFNGWKKGSSVTLTKWDGFRDAKAIKLRRVTFRFINDPAAQVAVEAHWHTKTI